MGKKKKKYKRPFKTNFKLKNKKIMKKFKTLGIALLLIGIVGFVVYTTTGPNSRLWNQAGDTTSIQVDTLVVDSVAVDTVVVDSVE